MNYFKTLSIRRTTSEWKILEQKVSEAGKDDLGQLLRIKIAEFLIEYENCPDCKTKANGKTRPEKRPSIYHNQIKKLQKIGEKMGGLSPSKVVDRLIIEPLLNNENH